MNKVACLLIVGAFWPAFAYAFNCAKAVSATEKAICANADLKQADDAINAAWRRSISAGGDANARKRAQQTWLRQRDACASDVACLGKSYQERLAALDAAAPTGATFRWQRHWQRASESPGLSATLTIDGTAPNFKFTIDASNGGNTGSVAGAIVVANDRAMFSGDDGCRLDFSRSGARLFVKQSGRSDCGAGAGVDFRGEYVTAAEAKTLPATDLATLGIVADEAADQAVRKLLGNENYQALLDSCNVVVEGDDLDGFGARVRDCFVRGIANTNAALVMSDREKLWIEWLDFAPDHSLHMRYYTNVGSAGNAIPKTVRHWLDDKSRANAGVGSDTPLAIPIDKQP